MKKTGLVSIIGAGPGDPELLTQKAVRRLSQANFVLHDALIPPEILGLAPQARCFLVGRRVGQPRPSPGTVNQLLIHAATWGKRLVRLKSGDPFVLGRGGEELQFLRKMGIPFEVIPGISSAIAAPAFAGIPVTHRGLASAFTVVSGHAESAYLPILKAIVPNSLTLIVLMGIKRRAELASVLLAQEWNPVTPTAIVFGACTPQGHTWIGTLEDLGMAPSESPPDIPGTIIVGDVVSLSPIAKGDMGELTLSLARASHGRYITRRYDDADPASNVERKTDR